MTALAARYRRFAALRLWLLAAMAVVLCLTLALDLATGPSGLPFTDVTAGLLQPGSLSLEQRVILWEVRLPYAVMALLVGASLGLAGAEMQTALNNPLASPFTLGLSAAAAVGASIALPFSTRAPTRPRASPVPRSPCSAPASRRSGTPRPG